MLNIYLGRESLNKEKFMYNAIRNATGQSVVLVPNQYTLEAERQAFRYLNTEVLLDVEITSFSRLGSNLISKYGRKDISRIDEYGRYMILTKIFLEYESELRLFGMSRADLSNSFVQLVNDFIADSKLANISPADFDGLISDENIPDMLRDKLKDLALIFEKYEEEISGKFVDSEDYITLYKELIPESEKLKASDIWIYGFDSFTPKNTDVIAALCVNARSVNVVLTDSKASRDDDIFAITRVVTQSLCRAVSELGCAHEIVWIGEEYLNKGRAQGIRAIERELFALNRQQSDSSEGITIVKSSNVYSEIESAASYVLDLLSAGNLRYRDIAIICNDQSVRLPMIKRTFEEYGIDLFDDSKRSIINSPIAVYLISLLETVSGGYKTRDVLTAAKTGLTDLSDDETEDLELYANKYRIRNNGWKKPFTHGKSEYGEEALMRLEDIRKRLMKSFEPIENLSAKAETMREFTSGCYEVLAASTFIENIEKVILAQRAAGLNDSANESEQIWAQIVHAFDQIVALMGDQSFDLKMFIEILVSGLAGMEVGVIPPTVDDVILGTMQRTRIPDVKAMLVIGANEGLLPMAESEDYLFSPEEVSLMNDKLNFGDKSSVMSMEERLAIYRNLSKPIESLWISYSVSDVDGTELRPSEIVQSLHNVFPNLKENVDVISEGRVEKIVGGRINTVRQMTQMMNMAKHGEKICGDWKVVRDWINEKHANDMSRIIDGLYFSCEERPISKDTAKILYQRGELAGSSDFAVSPSRLEKFSRCPFAHFISYGLKPKEERVYEAGSREIGDMHHEVMAVFAEYLTTNNLWESITKDEVFAKVREIMTSRAEEYREALFRYTSLESYKLRRAIEVSCESCFAMVEHYRAGRIKASFYEIDFGRRGPIKPVIIDTGDGKVYIEGKIDRLDILPDDSVKIIDYKTGKEYFDLDEVLSGYRLQLMIYLKAAEENKKQPAGAFYFLIGDPAFDASGISKKEIFEEISQELKNFFKLNGIIVDGADTVRNIAGEFSKKSDVMSISLTKDGAYKGSKNNYIMSPEAFEELQGAFDEIIENLCSALVCGDISISPKKGKGRNPCDYCQFRSICKYDLHKDMENQED